MTHVRGCECSAAACLSVVDLEPRDKVLAKVRAWLAMTPEACRVQVTARRCLLEAHGAEGGSLTLKLTPVVMNLLSEFGRLPEPPRLEMREHPKLGVPVERVAWGAAKLQRSK